jgi:hypothetical protein
MSEPMFSEAEIQAALNAMQEAAVLNGPGILSFPDAQKLMAAAGRLCEVRGGTLAESAVMIVGLLRSPHEPRGIFGPKT